MSVDISDLLKYGWMLLLTFVPKLFSSINSRFRNLETRDKEMTESLVDLQKEVAVISTKLDASTEAVQEMKTHLENIYNILTELRIEQSRQSQR
jgi:predicted  nucleic acid-binding Zn-ribbon protein